MILFGPFYKGGAKKNASRETVGLLLAEGLHFCFPNS